MKAETLDIKLKRNSNISFKITPKFCKCSRPMFLKKSQDGNVFWACKGFYPDESVCVCDLTKDVKCFKCSGEIRKKENKNTGEKFYGCTNYSTVSEEGCNFTLDPVDMEDVITQVNDALKFHFNFRSTQFDSGDERIWEKYKKEHVDDVKTRLIASEQNKMEVDNDDCDCDDDDDKEKVETKWWFKIIRLVLNKKKSDKKPEKSYMGIPPKILKYTIIGIFIMLSMGIISGAGIEASFFKGMFTFRINPKEATAEEIAVEFDEQNNTFTIENTTGEDIDISSVEVINEAGYNMIDLDKLPQSQQIIKANDKLVLHEHDINNLVTDEMMAEVEEEMDDEGNNLPGAPQDDSYVDTVFDKLRTGALNIITKTEGTVQKVQTTFEKIRYREPQEEKEECDGYGDDCDGDIDGEEIRGIEPKLFEERREEVIPREINLR